MSMELVNLSGNHGNISFCAYCGKPFIPRRPTQRYCMSSHRKKAFQESRKKDARERKGLKTCKKCGKNFAPYSAKQIFCSTNCQKQFNNHRLYKSGTAHIVHPPKPGVRKCLAPEGNPNCQDEFYSTDRTKFVYCSSCRDFFDTATVVWDAEEWGVGNGKGWR